MSLPSGEDNWLKEYEKSQYLVSEILQATTRRRQLTLGNFEHATLSSQLRKQLAEAELQINGLLKALEDPYGKFPRNLAVGEKERRHRLCETLQSSVKKASDEVYKGMPHQGPFTKVEDLGTANWGEDETEATRTLSNSEIREQQQNMLTAQEESLENLSKVVRSQKRIGKAIQAEAQDQDDLLIDVRDRVGNTHNNLERETANVTEATRKSSTCGYWVVILLLLIAIIVVAVW